MLTDTDRSVYRFIKWAWLLTQCAMPVLAAAYLGSYYKSHSIESTSLKLLINASGSLYLIFWLIAEAVLCMARFPLKTGQAAALVGGFIIQFIVLTATGGSIGLAAFTGIYVTLAALYVCLAILIAAFSKTLVWQDRRRGLAAVVVLALGLIPMSVLFFPLWAAYRDLAVWVKIVNLLVLLGNVLLTVRSLVDFSIWGKPDPQHDQYYKEWERWAAPTIILLILTATAAIVVMGISGAADTPS